MKNQLFARVYPWLSRVMERRGGDQHRRDLLAGLSGQVVEVGAGHGINFAYYPSTVTQVVAIEPEQRLRAAAMEAAEGAPVSVDVRDGLADRLPLPDASCDAAVVSLVLCSVPDQDKALAEIARVLRPGGELRFYEHVRSRQPRLARVQELTDVVWPRVFAGCHTSRDTVGAIEAAGFALQQREHFRFPPSRVFLPPSPHVLGVASKS